MVCAISGDAHPFEPECIELPLVIRMTMYLNYITIQFNKNEYHIELEFKEKINK